jgi:hypothetical protein
MREPMKPLWLPLWIACGLIAALLFYFIGRYLDLRNDLEAAWRASDRVGLASLEGMVQATNTLTGAAATPLIVAEEMVVQELGTQTPDGAAALNRLANFCALQGDYAKAERLYRQLIGILTEHLGPDHPDVALVRENLKTLATLKAAAGNPSAAGEPPTPTDQENGSLPPELP